MKKYILLIIAAIFCLPNIGFAQGWSLPSSSETIDPSQGAMASTWFIGKYGGTSGFDWGSQKESKKIQKPRTKLIHAIENTTDEATGQTTVRWADGSSYVGEIYRTVFHGTGTMIYPDSSKYYGGWKYSYRDGVGTMEYADGSKYIGQWVRDIPNGDGTLITPEGTAFSGKFKNGVPHGKCIMQSPDGKLYKARWYYGKLRKRSVKPLEEK